MGVFPDLKPRPLTPGEFRCSNVFVAYSRKLDRSVDLIGPTLHDAWLMLEFDPSVAWFCERPPHDIDLLPLEGKQRPIDFWVCEVSGRNAQIIVYCPEVAQDKKISLDHLKRSVAASKMNCQIWMGADLQRRRTYLRNLKQLQPFLAEQGARDHSLGDKILSCVRANGEVRWVDVMSSVKAWSPPSVNREVAYLIHHGQLTADLASQPLTLNTELRSA